MRKSITTIFFGMALLGALQAYPPVPHFVIEGNLRDELGRPLEGDGVEVRLLAENGQVYRSMPNAYAGRNINYQMVVPVDGGLAGASYHRLAQWPEFAYRIEVMVDGVQHVPIELRDATPATGQSGQVQVLNLTLGEDLDGDGLPDLWESMLAEKAGGIENVHPEDDSDGDGISNLQEYYSGTLAFDAENGFRLNFKELTDQSMVFEFMAVRGRMYRLMQSNDLVHWEDTLFEVRGNNQVLSQYLAPASRAIEIMLPSVLEGNSQATYKLIVK
ncbi:MAG: hypothetical protein HN758_04445 [Verrucomicrobia bacterium]|jgi:hypothetical protein|nr:hypothetical protein [Verrucomicrobiota bacterium]MBT5477932.1 hypothetical protein [Verrucomicrobiota bacterium]MBT6238403.1 hypothetical protein [Verrucomicrobiota bacterium]MBT7873657.1 hypothetical protein [Verrucomicrobiota bacterium]